MFVSFVSLLQQFASACTPGKGGNFLGFPTWYKYLESETVAGRCTPKLDLLNSPIQIAGILFALLEILLRIAALAAIVFIVIGGVQYMTSQGQPDQTSKARGTVINAVIGLVIAVAATALITFIAGRFIST